MLGEILSAGASILGGVLGNSSAKKAADRNFAQQKKFAQNQLQWKAADAEKAGISKVFAMGAPTQSFTPSNVGGNFDFLSSAGQNIGRALQATASPGAQNTGLSKVATAIGIEGAQLDNDIKRAQLASIIATTKQAGSPPGPMSPGETYAIAGQPPTLEDGAPNIKAQSRIEAADPTFPANTAGFSPSVAYQRNNTGGYSPYIPNTMAESYESDHLGGAEWSVRNRLIAPIMGSEYGPRVPMLPWQTMYFNPKLWQWEVRDRSEFGNRAFGRFNTRR